MEYTLFTATGCARCKITKRYLKDNDIPFTEHDFKAEGKDAFAQFYRANRKSIFRDKDGVDFPVFFDGSVVKQTVSTIIGHLASDSDLSGFISRSLLHGEWIDGFDVSGGNPEQAEGLLVVLDHLKKNGLKIQLTSDGTNADLLETLLEKGLGDRLILEVKGPAHLYGPLSDKEISAEKLAKSIKLACQFPEFEVFTIVAPLVRADGVIEYITPEEIGETAKLIEEASQTKKNPYLLKTFDPESTDNEKLKNIDSLEAPNMFRYRTQARRYQVMTEIEK
jgi:glutaredoxin/pyruvate-formate lyase-activating enzyme